MRRYARARLPFVLIACFIGATQFACRQKTGLAMETPQADAGISLRAACSFHAKFEYICGKEHLDLKYWGWLAKQWRRGACPSIDNYDVWGVKAFYERDPTGRKADFRFRPLNREEERGENVIVEHVFFFSVGHFPGHEDAIPIKMGPYRFDVLVLMVLTGKKDLDAKNPILGTSIREFVKRLEKKNFMDEILGLVTQEDGGRPEQSSGDR